GEGDVVADQDRQREGEGEEAEPRAGGEEGGDGGGRGGEGAGEEDVAEEEGGREGALQGGGGDPAELLGGGEVGEGRADGDGDESRGPAGEARQAGKSPHPRGDDRAEAEGLGGVEDVVPDAERHARGRERESVGDDAGVDRGEEDRAGEE